jgi:hypothetical protein
MSSGYVNTAYTYDEDNLPFDEEGNKYEPSPKELDLFREQKSNMYKGTWMICFIYGLSAIGLLGVIIFTDWGREYIYNKFLPAVLTYVLGAIIIIIYLIFSIFALVPTKIKTSMNKMPVCPDYWHLENVDTTELDVMNKKMKILTSTDDQDVYAKKNIDLKCVPDTNVFGDNSVQYESKKNLYLNKDGTSKFKVGVLQKDKAILTPTIGTNCGGSSEQSADQNKCAKIYKNADMYIYRERDAEDGPFTDINNKKISRNNDNQLDKYSEIAGMYNYDHTSAGTGDTHSVAQDHQEYRLHGEDNDNYNKKPLVCNKIYPKLLNAMEPNGDDSLKCDVAKICGLSWSKIDCYSDVDDIGSAIM